MGAPLKRLVLHCTATTQGREVTAKEIYKWHTDPVSKGGRGWKQVGYTDLFHLDGRVERLVENNEDAQLIAGNAVASSCHPLRRANTERRGGVSKAQ